MPTVTATVTNDGRNMIRDSLQAAVTPTISFVALGSSNTAPSVNDHTLGAEVFRKAVTSYANGTTGEILINLYLAPGDAVGANIQEIGFFGGDTASSTANTGILLARGLWAHNPKSSTESIIFALDYKT